MAFKSKEHQAAVMLMLRKVGKLDVKAGPAKKRYLRNPVSVPYTESRRTLQVRKRFHQRRKKARR